MMLPRVVSLLCLCGEFQSFQGEISELQQFIFKKAVNQSKAFRFQQNNTDVS